MNGVRAPRRAASLVSQLTAAFLKAKGPLLLLLQVTREANPVDIRMLLLLLSLVSVVAVAAA